MHIQAAANAAVLSPARHKAVHAPARESAGSPAPGNTDAVADKPAAEDAAEKASEPRGVLRLLEEGHFKGVAAVRLRINFAEQLEGRTLPELTPPKGAGKAYAKFLEQYEAMQPPPELPEEPQEPPVEPPAEDPASPDEPVNVLV